MGSNACRVSGLKSEYFVYIDGRNSKKFNLLVLVQLGLEWLSFVLGSFRRNLSRHDLNWEPESSLWLWTPAFAGTTIVVSFETSKLSQHPPRFLSSLPIYNIKRISVGCSERVSKGECYANQVRSV